MFVNIFVRNSQLRRNREIEIGTNVQNEAVYIRLYFCLAFLGHGDFTADAFILLTYWPFFFN